MKTIYFGGNIIAENGEKYDYLICENGIIKKLGKGIFSETTNEFNKVNLKGKTLMTAFMDAHSHLSACAYRFLQESIKSADSNKTILSKIKNFIHANKINPGEWVCISDYEPEKIKDNKLSTKELDLVAPNNPMVLQYCSGHMGVFNSAALKFLNIDKTTPSSEGGLIEKDKNGNPTGYVEEKDFVERQKLIPPPSIEKLSSAFEKAQDLYLSYGIITAQEGFASKELLPLYKYLHKNNKLKINVVLYPDITSYEDYIKAFPKAIKKYDNHLKIGGVKVISDGSPQGRTAWMRTPYLDKDGKTSKDGYCGYPSIELSDLIKVIKFTAENDLQLLVHCNGDKAAEVYIQAEIAYGHPNTRPVMIHAQLLGTDQMDDLKKAGIIPSFFVAHILHWGDIHIKNFGIERASQISPLSSAIEKGILFTLHQDAPVIQPNMFETLYCATERITEKGVLLGTNQKININEAINAVTKNVAYQYFEENECGSIKEGMRENLIILNKNPFEINHNELTTIKIEQTILDGKILFSL